MQDWKELCHQFLQEDERVLESVILPLGKKYPHEEELKNWLSFERHGNMKFMENHLEMRLDPKELFSEARSALVFLYKYPVPFLPYEPKNKKPLVSAYAQGVDYHRLMKKKCAELAEFLKAQGLDFESKAFVDSAPVYERDLALLAGLGWVGKNTCLINRKFGSGFFIGGMLLSLEAENFPLPQQDFCGKCTKCLEACPTQAFVGPWQLDARKCISYQTIENQEDLDLEIVKHWEGRIYGCDICQQVCPWNHKHLGKEQNPNFSLSIHEWKSLTEIGGGFKSRFKNTALERGGRKNLHRNVRLWEG